MHTGLVHLEKLPDETICDFVKRQDDLGSTEIACRIAARLQFGLSLEDAISACEQERGLRIREIQNEIMRYPNRSGYSRSLWVQKSFGINKEQAMNIIKEASQ